MSDKLSNLKNIKINSFNGGMNKDIDPQLLKESQYSHAINAKINSHEGNFIIIQNEPSTIECYSFEKEFLSAYRMKEDLLVVFLGEGVDSEIGIFDKSNCTYISKITTPCLNFNKKYPPKSIYQEIGNCDDVIYFVDNFNPNRYLNFNDIPYITVSDSTDDCATLQNTEEIDCDRLLLKKPLSIPCLSIERSKSGGKLTNSQNQVAIAYAESGVRVTDIYSITQGVSLFSHSNEGGGVDVEISNIDKDYNQYFIYLLQTTSNNVSSNIGSTGGVTTVYEYGPFNITQKNVHIENTNDIPTIPLSLVPLQSVVYDKSKDIVSIDNRALWIGATTKPRFNYQPLANQITSKWVAYTVEEDYYRNGGIEKSNMRDEVYPYGIQWLNTQGQWSDAYHIPGRSSKSTDRSIVSNLDSYELQNDNCIDEDRREKWQVYDTSTGSINVNSLDKCTQTIVGTGELSFWESKDLYPNNVEVYGELACQPIRHHKMPDICRVPYQLKSGNKVLLGMQFENIPHPVDCDGNKLTDIVGYRIVRGDRTNHKSIQAKGLLFNAAEYELPNTGEKAYYPNYPFNDLSPDEFISKKLLLKEKGITKKDTWEAASTFRNDVYTFHSPSTEGFNQRFTFGTDIFIEGEYSGKCSTVFTDTYKHPNNVIITNYSLILSIAFGIFTGIKQAKEDDDGLIDKITDIAGLLGGVATGNPIAILLNAISLIEDKIGNLVQIPYYALVNTELALDTIQKFARPKNFVLQANSLANYNTLTCSTVNNRRRRIDNIEYLYPGDSRFSGTLVNNKFRESSVIFSLTQGLSNPTIVDTTRKTCSQANICTDVDKQYDSTASSFYASIRRKLDSQYGQVDQIEYLDTGYCEHNITFSDKYSTDVVFGGDTFLTEYTLKRKMQYFTDSAFDVIDNYEFDYSLYPNLPYPRYWMNTFKYDPTELLKFDFDGKLNLPSVRHNLDCDEFIDIGDGDGNFELEDIKELLSSIYTKNGDEHMYLSNNGVLSFVVESEFNLDLRDWDDREGRRHYDKKQNTNLSHIFRQDFKDIDNDQLYNQAYSQQLTQNFIKAQDRDFTCSDESCFTTLPNRVFYSLQYQEGSQVDNWRSYLANNYYDFPKEAGNLITTKSLDGNNIVFLFDKSAPWMITAQDTLQTDGGRKVTIGDGGLFSPPPRPILTTDTNYGAISHNALTHTQYGLFYPSANQGRIYVLQGTKLEEININGMKWWLRENMPFHITESFAEVDTNLQEGIGYKSVFDNKDELYYITKLDYRPLNEEITFNADNCKFYLENEEVSLNNPLYFEDCSWTLSYSPQMKAFISFHDWHPDHTIQTEDTPLTVKNNTVYKHNETCEHYCYFYEKQYPFTVEYVVNNGQSTSTLSSVEYSLECYKYFNNCRDKHHLLDYNFNRAFIHNSEQVSGDLHLNLAAKNDITKVCSYPRVYDNYIDIQFSKVEQKYRFNQFWDITRNRAEFNSNYVPLLETQCNGYMYKPNDEYINYDKPLYERKKFRHNWNKIYLSRVDNDKEMSKMIFKYINSKQILSTR